MAAAAVSESPIRLSLTAAKLMPFVPHRRAAKLFRSSLGGAALVQKEHRQLSIVGPLELK
jgi:hypothetical protein